MIDRYWPLGKPAAFPSRTFGMISEMRWHRLIYSIRIRIHTCLIRNSRMQVGAAAHVKFEILPFRVKTQGLVLTGCAWQYPC
jgi:hypothetical protein